MKISAVVIVTFLLSVQGAFADAQKLSKDRIIEIAERKASELGFDLGAMTVTYDESNEMIKEHLRFERVSDEGAYPKLTDRDYQAVYFAPKQMQFGGDLWVFVDRNMGDVIDTIEGE